MKYLKISSLLIVLVLGLAACDDKQAQNNTPTKPSSGQMEPQTDQSAPATQKPKP